MDTSRESDRAEIISEAHAEFMRALIERGNLRSQQAIDRFLAARLKAKGERACPAPVARLSGQPEAIVRQLGSVFISQFIVHLILCN